MDRGAWYAAVHGVAKSRTRLSDFTFTFLFHALEKETATHSSVLAWRIPGTGEPGGLPSMGLHRVRHDWSDLAAAAAAAFCHGDFSAVYIWFFLKWSWIQSLMLMAILLQLNYIGISWEYCLDNSVSVWSVNIYWMITYVDPFPRWRRGRGGSNLMDRWVFKISTQVLSRLISRWMPSNFAFASCFSHLFLMKLPI